MNHFTNSILCLFVLMSAPHQISASVTTEQMNFSVWLDDKQIGYYRVSMERSGNREQINITTKLVWKFLSIPFYTYTHSNAETWQGQCLTNMTSETDDNGEKNFVQAQSSGSGMALRSHAGEARLEGCIRSFAYWDPELLKTEKLLNSQTGEYTPVTVSILDPTDFTHEKSAQSDSAANEKPAWGYRLTVGGKKIDLWYTENSDWLALQTRVKGGRLLGYYRTNEDV